MSTTHIEKFIEDAHSGGYLPETTIKWNALPDKVELKGNYAYFWGDDEWDVKTYASEDIHKILLSPEAWKAVSKTRDWNQGNYDSCPTCEGNEMTVDWRYYMHQFIEDVAMGKSINQALEAINISN